MLLNLNKCCCTTTNTDCRKSQACRCTVCVATRLRGPNFFFCPWALSGFTQLKTIIDLLRISAQCVLLWQWLNSTCSSITCVAGPHTHMLTRHINSFIICWKCVYHTHRVVCDQYPHFSHQMCFLFRSEPLCDACFAHHRSKKYKSKCEKSESSLSCFVPCCTAFIAFLCREWIKKKYTVPRHL